MSHDYAGESLAHLMHTKRFNGHFPTIVFYCSYKALFIIHFFH